MSAIELKNTSFSYRIGERTLRVLNQVSLQIRGGEMVAIKGPSGSGKSTLLYLMAGLLRPSKGEVLIEGQALNRFSPDGLAFFRNQKIGFVFQQFHLLPKATVLDNIVLPTHYPCELRKTSHKDKERATEMATLLGLKAHLSHYPNQLSGGQQQRVAIARALMNEASLILADEPTGNLDSKSSAQILKLLSDLNKQGKTVVIITHDDEVASHCDRTLYLKDGVLEESGKVADKKEAPSKPTVRVPTTRNYAKMFATLLPLTLRNISRNKARAALTMLGIVIGVAAVLAMVTVGLFTKDKILEGYAELGVNTFVFRGHKNWRMKATDDVSVYFDSMDWDRDLKPLKNVFPEIAYISPLMMSWGATASFGGQKIENDIRVMGVNENAGRISGDKLIMGKPINEFHVAQRSAVCVIGYEVAQKLFSQVPPVGQILFLSNDQFSYGCKVIGVLESRTSNKDWMKPNLQVVLPFTYFKVVNGPWSGQIHTALFSVKEGHDIIATGNSVKALFERKYGLSGWFSVGADSVLIANMKRFLNIFTIMLAVIALIALAVGGIGITNMMLVSVTERFKEIGLRKAIGATDSSIRIQFLLESVTLCAIAGVLGLILGFGAYQSVIYGASRFMDTLQFQWVIEPAAVLLSFGSILLVGIGSGLFPALKAEKLQVIEALRSE